MKTIDLETWPRRSHFEHFSGYANPYVGLVAPVDVTALYRWARAQQIGLFKPLLWAVSAAANRVPALRQRIRDGQVVEHSVVHPSYTTLTAEDVFNFATVDFDSDVGRFFASVDAENSRIASNVELIPDAPHRDDLLFVSSIPWRRITAFTHPVPLDPADSFVRITFARAEPDAAGRVEVSVGVQAHHALVDGVHIAKFFDAVEDVARSLQG